MDKEWELGDGSRFQCQQDQGLVNMFAWTGDLHHECRIRIVYPTELPEQQQWIDYCTTSNKAINGDRIRQLLRCDYFQRVTVDLYNPECEEGTQQVSMLIDEEPEMKDTPQFNNNLKWHIDLDKFQDRYGIKKIYGRALIFLKGELY
jgi:hypothetical protein